MMFRGALRLLSRQGHCPMRSARQVLVRGIAGLCLTVVPVMTTAADVQSARFAEPTERYGHGVLGDAVEYGALRLSDTNGRTVLIRLPRDHVFEDITPRLADVDGDGTAEVVVIETDMAKGAALAIYGMAGKIAETPHIGRTHRWLAPIGVGDLDGDGRIELAYIDRPHLAKTLRIWRFENGALHHVVDQPGLTNHRIGWDYIPGGIRTCGGAAEMITASADWTQLMATSFNGKTVHSRSLGAYSAQAVKDALACR